MTTAPLRIFATNDMGASLVPVMTTTGPGGTCAGLVSLYERECERGPCVWLDAGDATFGPLRPLLGRRPWAEVGELPIAAMAAGNHEFDEGVEEVRAGAAALGFPLLCANVDAGLAATATIETDAGPLGVIGLTHPQVDRFSRAPAPVDGWSVRVVELARELRAGGARWVVALLHDGVTWWPDGDRVATRAERLEGLVAPWSGAVDLIVGGHVLAAWTGTLAGTPAGHAHSHAASALVVDLPERPGVAIVRGIVRAPSLRPAPTEATRALDAAAARVVGHSEQTWATRTGAPHYLPRLIADALRAATGADAAMFAPNQQTTQAPIDGAVAALCAGPVSELDLLRLFDRADDVVVVELRPGELRTAAGAHDALTSGLSRMADDAWWNWSRMPVATSAGAAEPGSVAVMPGLVPQLSEWLGRDLDPVPAGIGARTALARALAA